MQRLSDTALSFSLAIFVTTLSLALISAAWLMALYFLNDPARLSISTWPFALWK
ncbi:hypothetical protein [Spirosoma pollinicola]|uniref:hypothetical protein n=1 Tax=Spirosoma pollinicola TaxID=2057025 RepID=UPI0012FD7DBB|nr:hypothetical protein [Spirosoma pollinicola]